MLTLQEIRQTKLPDLIKELVEARKKKYAVTIGVRSKHLKSTHEPKKWKKYIAQLNQQKANLVAKSAKTEEKAEKVEKTEEKASQ